MSTSMTSLDFDQARARDNFRAEVCSWLDSNVLLRRGNFDFPPETKPPPSRSGFQTQLSQVQMLNVVDSNTLSLATSLFAHAYAVENIQAGLAAQANDAASSVTVISMPDMYVGGKSILCVDVDTLGVDLARGWAERHGEQARRDGRLLVAAIGRKGLELSPLVGLFHAMVRRPLADSPTAWAAAVRPAWLAHQDPEHVDELPASETQGGVSELEFNESLFQLSLLSNDRRRRD